MGILSDGETLAAFQFNRLLFLLCLSCNHSLNLVLVLVGLRPSTRFKSLLLYDLVPDVRCYYVLYYYWEKLIGITY